MRKEEYQQIVVIKSDDAKVFQDEVNDHMKFLSGNRPHFELLTNKEGFCGIITYTEKAEFIETVADEFHAEGIYYLCKHCPHLDDPHDKRVKRCTCKYARTGITYKDSEACEIFYKELKRGEIKPLADYMR